LIFSERNKSRFPFTFTFLNSLKNTIRDDYL
jgi:hypothetical protein